MALGKALTSYGSKLFSDPLAVVQMAFNGYDLGKTVDTTTLKPDLDIKDINYQQNGTKPADHVITGADWILSCTLGEISTETFTKVFGYLVGSAGSAGADSGYFKTDMYKSMLTNNAKVLKVASVTDQSPDSDSEDIAFFYNAIPTINADLVQWGNDVQRNLAIEFKIKIRVFTVSESATIRSAYGYWGDPSAEGIPAVVWPDIEAPYVVSANVVSATSVTVTFNETVTEISAITTEEQAVVKVGNLFIVPTASAYLTNVLTLTLPALSIASGDTVELYIASGTCEDADDNANDEIDGLVVTNSI